jgi:hypothetical protein
MPFGKQKSGSTSIYSAARSLAVRAVLIGGNGNEYRICGFILLHVISSVPTMMYCSKKCS